MKERIKNHKLTIDKNKLSKKGIKSINQIFALKETDKLKSKKNISNKKQIITNKLEPIKVRLTPFNKRYNSKGKKSTITESNAITESNNNEFNKSLYLSPTHASKSVKDSLLQNKFSKRNYTESRNDIKEIKLNRNCTTPYRRIINNKYGDEFSPSTSVIIKNFNYNNVYNFNIDNEKIRNKKIQFSNKQINKNNDITYNEAYSNTCSSKFTYNKPKTSTGIASSCVSTKNKNSETFFKTFIKDTNLNNRINNFGYDDISFNVPKLELNSNKRNLLKTQYINHNNNQLNKIRSNFNNYNLNTKKLNKYMKTNENINNTFNSRLKNHLFSNLNLKAKSINKFYKTPSLSLKYKTNTNSNSNDSNNYNKKFETEVNNFNLDYTESEENKEIGFNLNDLFIFEDRINDIVSAFTNRNNIYDIEASNECNEFINFYSKSSLKGIFNTFFKENNQLIIESSINLFLYFILIIHHLSINNILFNEIISTINNILSLLKLNFALYTKQIQLFYGPDVIQKNYIYFHPFNTFLNNKDIKDIESEDDITYKIYNNCRIITNEVKIIMNYYQNINMNYYNYFIKIFNNISIQNETDLINIFFKGFKNENNSFNLITVNKNPYNIKSKAIHNESAKHLISNSFVSNDLKNLSVKRKNILENIYIKTPKKIINKFTGFKKVDKKNRIQIPYIKDPPSKKYTLLLNLNKTLAFYNKGNVILRTGLFSFLSMIKPYYEIISFSSEPDEINKSIIKQIESKEKIFDYNFGKEHCILYENTLVKDISLIGRDLTNIIIVDDNENSFKLNQENGIKISKFEKIDENNEIDNALFELKKILILIYNANYNDIRMALKDFESEIKNKISGN